MRKYNLSEAAKYLGVTDRTVHRRIRAGDFPAGRVIGTIRTKAGTLQQREWTEDELKTVERRTPGRPKKD